MEAFFVVQTQGQHDVHWFLTESRCRGEQSNYMSPYLCRGSLNWKRDTALCFHFPSHTENLNSLFHLHLKVSARLKQNLGWVKDSSEKKIAFIPVFFLMLISKRQTPSPALFPFSALQKLSLSAGAPELEA